MTPKDWINDFLSQPGRSLDGRPLYAYRMTREEYDQLISMLLYANQYGIENIALNLNKWSMAFVIFASEWWRREYDGGSWSWEPIFKKIGADSFHLSPSDRGKAVELGLQYWKRKVKKSDHQREFFVTVTMEGGLPLKLLNSSNNAHGEILRSVTKEMAHNGCLGKTAVELVEYHKHKLPRTFQQKEVYNVLAQIAEACVALREISGIMEQSDPVTWLNKNLPDWERKFPLNLSDEAAKTLIQGLVREAIKIRVDGKSGIKIIRSLVKVGEYYQLVAKVDFFPKKKISEDVLKTLMFRDNENITELPTRINLYVSSKSKNFHAAILNKMIGGNDYSIRTKNISFRGLEAAKELNFHYKDIRNDELADVLGISDLDPELPGIFSADNSHHNFIGQGRARIKDDTCLIVLCKNKKMSLTEGSECNFLGKIKGTDWSVFLFLGEGKIYYNTHYVRIKTKQDLTNFVEYELYGKNLPWESHPKHIYFGKPFVQEQKEEGYAHTLASRELIWRHYGQKDKWHKGQDFPNIGVIELAALDKESHELLFRRKIGLLPAQAKVNFTPGETEQEGSITFGNFGTCFIRVKSEDVTTTISEENNTFVVFLKSENYQPPSTVSIELIIPGQTHHLLLDLPFPARGGRFFLEDDPILPEQDIYMKNIYGLHAKLFFQSQTIVPDLQIHAYLSKNRNIQFYKKLPKVDSYLEVRLVDFEPEIKQLFAATENLYDKVVFTIKPYLHDEILAKLRLSQYACKFMRGEADKVVHIDEQAQKFLSLEQLESIRVHALQLNKPKDNPQKLAPVLIEEKLIELDYKDFDSLAVLQKDSTKKVGSVLGEWAFDPYKLSAGAWLIYPSLSSGIDFQPLLWNVKLDRLEGIGNTLRSAVLLESKDERKQAFEHIFKLMVINAGNKDWDFLEITLKSFGHLPLVTHDLLKRLVRNSDVMAGLFFLLEFDDFERFSEELPFMWERVPYASWCKGISLLKQKYQGQDQIFDLILKDKIDDLQDMLPALAIGLSQMRALAGRTKERHLPDNFSINALFERENSEVQKLLRANADRNRWPEFIHDEIRTCLDIKGLEDYRDLLNEAEKFYVGEQQRKTTVILTPILLGLEWVTGDSLLTPKPQKKWPVFLHEIRQIRSFDPEWFDEAFKWTIGYAINKNNKGKMQCHKAITKAL